MRELGRGSTARVELARLSAPFGDLPEGAEVAVKTLDPELCDDPRAAAALEAEAESGRALSHPSLARVLYIGRGPEGPYLVQQYVPGRSLHEILEQDGPLPEPIARSAGAQIASALAALHETGLVHGDVKPDNIRLDQEGRAVLVDLGFARRAADADSAHAGTLAWLSPERALGAPPTPAADVFALGVVLYELATGLHPFDRGDRGGRAAGGAPSAEHMLAAIADARFTPPSRFAPQLSPFFDALLEDLLRRGPEARPAADEVSHRLAEGESSAWWRGRIAADTSGRGDAPIQREEAHLTPLVGREDELMVLAARLDEVRANGRGSVVWLGGPAGSGKWRLVNEFAARARLAEKSPAATGGSPAATGGDPPLYLYARWSEVAESRPAGALLLLLHRWLQLPPGRPPGERQRALLEDLVAPSEARTLLSALHPEPEGRDPGSVAVALADWLEALSRSTLLLVFLDDVHRAGAVTLGALSRLIDRLGTSRVLLVLGLREEVEAADPEGIERLRARLEGEARTADGPSYLRLELAPLSKQAVRELVDRLFHHTAPRLRLAEVLWQRSRGNPGLLAELLRDLSARRMLHPFSDTEGALVSAVAPDDLPLPRSLDKLIAERFGQLAAEDRRWLERLAVVGGRIAADFLTRTFPPTSRAEIDQVLARLVRSGWLVPAGNRYRFTRPALREAVYRSLAPDRRRRLHAAAAQGLASEGEGAPAEEAFQRAFHLRAAARWNELLELVLPLVEALRLRVSAQRMQVLARWGLEALDHLPHRPEYRRIRLELLEVGADATDRLGLRQEERILLDRLVDLDVDPDRDPASAAHVYLLHGRYAAGTGQFGLARGMLRNAVQLAEVSGDAFLHTQAQRRLSVVQAQIGELADARDLAGRALERASTESQVALAHLAIAMVDVLEDHIEDALRRVQLALQELRRAELPRLGVVGYAHLLRARIWRSAGNPVRALAAARRALRLARRAGERRFEAEAQARCGGLLLDLDHPEEAEAELRDALLRSQEIEDRRGETLSRLWLGILLWEADHRAALATIDRARALAREIGFYRAEAVALGILSRVHRAADRLERADAMSARAAELIERHGAELVDRIAVLGTRALVLETRGRGAEARELLKELRRRMRRQNRLIRDARLRRGQRVYATRLLEAVLSPDGPVYPRFGLESTG
ncbi:MAG: protein kinase [Planctomycetota bacterium]|nr:protein kinase [Planctomycetota bacterium]